MEQIHKSLKKLITPDMIEIMSQILDEKESDINEAVSSIFAGFMSLTQRRGDTIQLRNIFDEAGSLNVLADIDSACGEQLTLEQLSIGDNFLQHILGDEAANFTTWVSLDASISRVATNRLVAMLAPVFVGYVGNKLVSNRWSMHKLLGMISNEKSTYKENVSTEAESR